jgi:hypothetical protein
MIRNRIAQSGLFDPTFYLAINPDVADSGMDALDHYVQFGWREGRRPHQHFDGRWYAARNRDICPPDQNPILNYLDVGARLGRAARKRTVVYSAVVGGYDQIRPAITWEPDLDYVVFTDDQTPEAPAPWMRRPLPKQLGNPRLTARYIKVHPHEVVPEYDVSMWVDSSFAVCAYAHRVESFVDSHQLALFAHPDRTCVFDELEAIEALRLEEDAAVENARRILELHGVSRNGGLSATGILIRRHHDQRVVKAMSRWWKCIAEVSGRDQLSIDLVLGLEGVPPCRIPGSVWHNELAQWVGHAPPNWNGLRCGGAYLDPAEYEALRTVVRELGITSVLETGAGETSRLFAGLGLRSTAIESRLGIWSDRALESGCTVAHVPFDPRAGRFLDASLAAALQPLGRVDFLFIDAPVGTRNRRNVLSQMLEHVSVRYVAYHDARRDLANILDDQRAFGLRSLKAIDSPRGLVFFELPARLGDG